MIVKKSIPWNRMVTALRDVQNRPVFTQVPNIDAVNYGYDPRGRLTTITQGSGTDRRSLAYTWGADGFVERITDAQQRETLYQRDPAGRITQAVLPGTRTIGTGYDANGNVTGVTPPNKPEHRFGYTPVDLAEQYIPPTISGLTTVVFKIVVAKTCYAASRSLAGSASRSRFSQTLSSSAQLRVLPDHRSGRRSRAAA